MLIIKAEGNVLFLIQYIDTIFDNKYMIVHFRDRSNDHFDGLVQERRNFIANALDLRLSCTNLSISSPQ